VDRKRGIVKKSRSFKLYCLFVAVVGLAMMPVTGLTEAMQSDQSDRQVVSFDTLFPTSAFKNALDTCMRMWGSIDHLKEQTLAGVNRLFLHDAMIGQVIALRVSVEDLLDEYAKGSTVYMDDVVYLLNVLNYVGQAYQNVVPATRLHAIAHRVLRSVKMELREFIARQ